MSFSKLSGTVLKTVYEFTVENKYSVEQEGQ